MTDLALVAVGVVAIAQPSPPEMPYLSIPASMPALQQQENAWIASMAGSARPEVAALPESSVLPQFNALPKPSALPKPVAPPAVASVGVAEDKLIGAIAFAKPPRNVAALPPSPAIALQANFPLSPANFPVTQAAPAVRAERYGCEMSGACLPRVPSLARPSYPSSIRYLPAGGISHRIPFRNRAWAAVRF